MDKEKLLWPLYADEFACLNCGDEIVENNHNHLCDKCFGNLHYIKNACQVCGDEVGEFDKICESCKKKKPYFTRVYAPFVYETDARHMVHLLKYNGGRYIVKSMGMFMVEKLKSAKINVDFIIPIPLAKSRLKTRGYNQSELLANFVGKEMNIPVLTDVVERVKNTHTQTDFDASERAENMKNAFRALNYSVFKGKNVLLIDDIITTGATMSELAKVIKPHKPKNIYGLTFCHT